MKGYLVFESLLVRVFEQITITILHLCDFMARADKVMRTDYRKALNGKKLRLQLRGLLHSIVVGVQRDNVS